MAFPDNVQTFTQAVDPSTTTDIENIQTYQQKLASGDFSGAQEFLAAWDKGIQMNLNAGRFNEIIKTIQDIETFYYGLNGVKSYIQNNIKQFSDINVWDVSITYFVGNIVSYDGNLYVSLIDNNLGNIPIGGTSSDTNWQLFVKNQQQYPVTSLQPTNQVVGDLWFQLVDDNRSDMSDDDNSNWSRD